MAVFPLGALVFGSSHLQQPSQVFSGGEACIDSSFYISRRFGLERLSFCSSVCQLSSLSKFVSCSMSCCWWAPITCSARAICASNRGRRFCQLCSFFLKGSVRKAWTIEYYIGMKAKRVYYPPTTPQQRKRLFEIWEQTHNVTAACRKAHVGRATFYFWKPRFDQEGVCGSGALRESWRTQRDGTSLCGCLKRKYWICTLSMQIGTSHGG